MASDQTVPAPPLRHQSPAEAHISNALLALDEMPNDDRLRQAKSLLVRARVEIESFTDEWQASGAP